VQRFRGARPEVEIELRERSTVEQLRAVSAGVVDVGLVRPPVEAEEDLLTRVVMRERTVAAIPSGHALARLRRVPLRRLATEPLVLFPRRQAPGFHDLLIGRMAATGTSPHVVQYAPEMLTIIGLVAAGIGVSPVPASVSRLELEGVVYRPLSGAPDTELLAVTRAREQSPLVEAFVADARAHAGDAPAAG
jgi:DNA-binding transcriptional LysR family regulator